MNSTCRISKRYLRKRWPFLSQNDHGTLYIEGVSVKLLAAKYGTPLQLLIESDIRRKLRRFKAAFPYANLRPQYAVKVNSNLEILKIVKEEGFDLDASSVGEIILGMLAGFRPEQITFTNLYKSEQDLLFASKVGVYAVTVDSYEELKRVVQVAGKMAGSLRVFLRINPLITYKEYSTRNQQYGIPLTIAKKSVDLATSSLNVHLVGFHFHGGYMKHSELYALAARKLASLGRYAVGKGAPLEALDLGGGFPYEYGSKTFYAPEEMGESFVKTFEALLEEHDLGKLRLIFEPGKFIVGNAGIGLMKIVSKKYLGKKKLVVTDGATYCMLPDTMVYKQYYDLLPATKLTQPRVRVFDICGCTCDCIDKFGTNRMMPRLQEGDLIAIMDCGAYSNVMASNFNTLKRPPIIMIKEDGSTKLVRRRDRYSEMFAPELDALKMGDQKELMKLYNLLRVNMNQVWNSQLPKAQVEQLPLERAE
ncbi:MAG TPA: hypothetical protein VFE88_01160 [Candidatus Nanoarchaeia archaeon]|nr:hypothetical protein [Candidatus Nanoarchaeia archaeon]